MLLFPHNLSDIQLGLLFVVVLPILGGLIYLFNAYRMGKLPWKPAAPANPRVVCAVVLIGIILAVAFLTMVG